MIKLKTYGENGLTEMAKNKDSKVKKKKKTKLKQLEGNMAMEVRRR